MENGHDVKPRLAEVASRLSSKEIPCIFCKKLWESRLTIINDKKDILGALDALGIKYEPIPGVVDYACYKCIYRINVIIDFRRLLERNINKTRANYYYAQGNKDMCRKFLLCNDANISNTANSTSSDNLNLLITDVRSEREPERTADFLFDCFNDPDMYSLHYTQENDESALNSSARLLEPMFETEFAESAGGTTPRSGSKYKNYNNLNDNKYNYKCQYCTKTYKRVHYLTKHERKHRAKISRRNSTRSATVTHSHECERCHEIFETKVLLKNHQKSHRNRIKCAYCSAEFYLRHDVELHEATCYGEMCARSDAASDRTHYTRSKTKPRKRPDSEPGSDDTDMDTLYSVRMRNVNKWVQNVEDDDCDSYDGSEKTTPEDDRMSVSSYAPSVASVFSRASTVVSGSSYTGTEVSSVISTQVHQHVRYEKPKLNSKLLSCKSSVHGGSKRTRAGSYRAEQLKQLDDLIRSRGENDFSTPNWQRIRNQAKRRNKARRNNNGEEKPLYICQYAKCYFFHKNLKEMMRHDIQAHFALPLYRCRECQYCFTRPIYLQCHTMEHYSGYHPCNFCNETFEYSHQLKYHLELHAIRSHNCPICPRSFLKEKELDQHMAENAHIDVTPKIDMVNYQLIKDAENTGRIQSQSQNDTHEGTEKRDRAFTVHYRPQRNDAKTTKYERIRLRLGSDLAYPTAFNALMLEPGTDEWLNESASKTTPVENISIAAEEELGTQEDDARPPGDIDLDAFPLFSIDALHLDEPKDTFGNSLYRKLNPTTLSSKRMKLQYYSTFAWPTKEFIFDPPLPSYASIMKPSRENSRIRILPLTNPSLPSRLPC